MLRIVSISAAAIALTFAGMTSLQAGEPHGVSYQDKKQGNVHFERNETGPRAGQDKSVEEIEPAAGPRKDSDETDMGEHEPDQLSEEMKLPRKN